MGTKMFTCLEAGLPFLANKELGSQSGFVTENNIGMAFSSAELKNVKGNLLNCDYKSLRRNVLRYNRENHFNKLNENFLRAI